MSPLIQNFRIYKLVYTDRSRLVIAWGTGWEREERITKEHEKTEIDSYMHCLECGW